MTKSNIKANRAFTLIELLVVISIILILLGIILPSLGRIAQIGYATKTTTRVNDIRVAIEGYKTENHALPLQNKMNLSTNISELLYAELDGEGLLKFSDEGVTKIATGRSQLLDSFPDAMPLLYFPTLPGSKNINKYYYAKHYKFEVNRDVYTPEFTSNKSGTVLSEHFKKWVWETNNKQVANPGGFIIFSAGMDRRFLCKDNTAKSAAYNDNISNIVR